MMKPPICCICMKPLDERGDLVTFAKTAADHEWDRQRITGHPPYADWFCGKHIEQARKRILLTFDEAMPQLRATTT